MPIRNHRSYKVEKAPEPAPEPTPEPPRLTVLRNHKTFNTTARALAEAEDAKALVAALREQLSAVDDRIAALKQEAPGPVIVNIDSAGILAAIDRLEATLTQPREVEIDVIRDRTGRLERVVARTTNTRR